MQNLQPLPNYSLADLFNDLRNGDRTEFTYNNVNFTVKKTGLYWYVTQQGTTNTATTKYYLNCMLDLQGMAACLLQYKHSIEFDREGNIKSKMYFIYPVENNGSIFNAGHSAQLPALTAIEALKKWYQHLETKAGEFKNLCYHAQEIPDFTA